MKKGLGITLGALFCSLASADNGTANLGDKLDRNNIKDI